MIRVAPVINDSTFALLFHMDFIYIVKTSYFKTFISLLSLAVVLVEVLLLLVVVVVVVIVTV
jgi:hypothetical protein